jgi:hypothetical protein
VRMTSIAPCDLPFLARDDSIAFESVNQHAT